MRAMVMRRLREAAGQGWGGQQQADAGSAAVNKGRGPALRWPSWWGTRLRTLLKPEPVWLACAMDNNVAPDEAAPADASALVPPHDEALVQWRAWCVAHEGARCRLALSSRWLLASAHEGGEAEALAASAAVWDRYLGLGPADLATGWMVRAGQAHGAAAVVAAPRGLVDDLLAVAAHHHVRVVWMGPWWAAEAERWLAAGARQGDGTRRLVFEEEGWRVHAQAVGRRLARLGAEAAVAPGSMVPAPPEHGSVQPGGPVSTVMAATTATPATTAAMATTVTLEGESVHPWPAGPGADISPGPWSLMLDFAGPRPRPAWWAWGLLATGLAALLAVADQADRLDAAHQDAEAQVKRLERAERQWRLQRALAQREASDREAGDLAGGVSARPAVAEPVLDAAAMDDALAMAQRLAYPWGAVLDEVEAAAAAQGVVLLGLGIDLEGGGQDGRRVAATTGNAGVAPPALPGANVRLQAAVPDDAAALTWAAALPEGGLLSRATLATPFTTGRGTYALKALAQAVMPATPQALVLPASVPAVPTVPTVPTVPALPALPAATTGSAQPPMSASMPIKAPGLVKPKEAGQ